MTWQYELPFQRCSWHFQGNIKRGDLGISRGTVRLNAHYHVSLSAQLAWVRGASSPKGETQATQKRGEKAEVHCSSDIHMFLRRVSQKTDTFEAEAQDHNPIRAVGT